MKTCPCHSGIEYAQCCKPYHSWKQHAPTALALMKSRYSAYALSEINYLIKTTHPKNPAYQKDLKTWQCELANYCRTIQCLGLTILNHTPGVTNSTVTFQAHLSQNGHLFTLTETSTFIKQDQHWLYYSGEVKTQSST